MSGFNCPQTFARAFDNNGAPAPGAKLYAFLAGTTIPKNLYFDFDLTQPCPHPIIADSDGNFEQYFLEGGAYKLSLFDQDDNQLRPPEEPIYGTGSVSAATLADVIANSDEIVWTEDEGDQLSGHLVWPLVPKAANYVESNASVYKALTGGSGYGTDEIVARRNGTEASRFGVEWGYAGNDAWTGIGDLDGTNIRFQPDAGGAGVDAFGDGAFKFGSLRVGDLAGGGANPLPVMRDNDGDLIAATSAQSRVGAGIREYHECVDVTVDYPSATSGRILANNVAETVIPSTAIVDGTVIETEAWVNIDPPDGADILFGLTHSSEAVFPGSDYCWDSVTIGIPGSGYWGSFASGNLRIKCRTCVGAITTGEKRRISIEIEVLDMDSLGIITSLFRSKEVDTSIATYPLLQIDLYGSGSVRRQTYHRRIFTP